MSGKPKRILNKFIMSKIDAVDRPAQEHARATLIKSEDGGEDMEITEEQMKKIAELAADSLKKKLEEGGEDTDLEKKSQEQFLEAEDVLVKSLTDDELAEYKEMEPEEQVDTVVAFAQDPDGFMDDLRGEGDDTDPNSIQKGDVFDPAELSGDQAKAILMDIMDANDAEDVASGIAKAVGGELEKAHKEIDALKADRNLEKAKQLIKSEFANLPGEDAEKAALMLALENLDDKSKELVVKGLKMANDNIASYMDETGTGITAAEAGKEPADVLDAEATKLAKANEITKSEAYIQLLQDPEKQDLFKIDAPQQVYGQVGGIN